MATQANACHWRNASASGYAHALGRSFVDKRRALDTVVNVTLLVTCVLVSAAAFDHLWNRNTVNGRPPSGPSYQLGEQLPQIDGINFAHASKTLILAVSSRCKYCTESMPFYARLAKERSAAGYRIVIVGFESEATLREYVGGHSLDVDGLKSIKQNDLKVSGTPTLILADASGKVQGEWRGLLGERETEVEAALR